jgi:threonine dehydratase
VIFEDVSKAAYYIRGNVRRTACELSPGLSDITGAQIFVKEEFKQYTGSFKERGARNALMQLPTEQKKKGVIAASAGNHALALSYHGGLLEVPVTVIMPVNAPLVKVLACSCPKERNEARACFHARF